MSIRKAAFSHLNTKLAVLVIEICFAPSAFTYLHKVQPEQEKYTSVQRCPWLRCRAAPVVAVAAASKKRKFEKLINLHKICILKSATL
jgi:hypothetical protein